MKQAGARRIEITMYPQAYLSPTPRPAKGSRQAAVCRTTSREFHPNCRSDRAAPIVWSCGWAGVPLSFRLSSPCRWQTGTCRGYSRSAR